MSSALLKLAVPLIIIIAVVAGFFVLKGKKASQPAATPSAAEVQTIPATGSVDNAAKALILAADSELSVTLEEAGDADLVTNDAAQDVERAVNENEF